MVETVKPFIFIIAAVTLWLLKCKAKLPNYFKNQAPTSWIFRQPFLAKNHVFQGLLQDSRRAALPGPSGVSIVFFREKSPKKNRRRKFPAGENPSKSDPKFRLYDFDFHILPTTPDAVVI